MIALLVKESAACAPSVLRYLRTFNRTGKLLKTRISVGCGLNEGEARIFEDSKAALECHRRVSGGVDFRLRGNEKTDGKGCLIRG